MKIKVSFYLFPPRLAKEQRFDWENQSEAFGVGAVWLCEKRKHYGNKSYHTPNLVRGQEDILDDGTACEQFTPGTPHVPKIPGF